MSYLIEIVFFFQAEDGIRDLVRSRGLGDVYKRQGQSVPPLLTSFEPDALLGALDTQPELPRGLLLDTLWTGWVETALTLDCRAIICNHALWDRSSVTQAKSAGFRTLSYTVNDEWAAQLSLIHISEPTRPE